VVTPSSQAADQRLSSFPIASFVSVHSPARLTSPARARVTRAQCACAHVRQALLETRALSTRDMLRGQRQHYSRRTQSCRRPPQRYYRVAPSRDSDSTSGDVVASGHYRVQVVCFVSQQSIAAPHEWRQRASPLLLRMRMSRHKSATPRTLLSLQFNCRQRSSSSGIVVVVRCVRTRLRS
jgi:hypothetical protein